MDSAGTVIMAGNDPFIVMLGQQRPLRGIKTVVGRSNADLSPGQIGRIALIGMRARQIDGISTAQLFILAMTERGDA